ncbi:MAG: dihydropteroate synthase [Bacteroidales bacterium]|nr:dihydropteroate synthase [Bacteroidales bacterium]
MVIRIMGILNLTPDSFYAPSRGDLRLLRSGADIIDIGAVSTRPGAAPVSLEEEWRRLEPVLRMLEPGLCFSIDTTRAEIVRRTYELAGPFIVNDISAGEDDPDMLPTVGKLGLEYIAMHKRGNPQTMDALTGYDDVVAELRRYFTDFAARAEHAGIRSWILDPGLGFAKTPAQCFEIIDRLEELRMEGHPILIGAADKRFTGGRTEEVHLRALHHGADILRVHDVKRARHTVRLFEDKSLAE